MTTATQITVIDARGEAHRYGISVSDAEPWCLKMRDGSLCESEFRDRDLFEALCRLREHFENKGEKVVCAGARFDVFPSGMSREMTGGRKAYVMKLGRQATEIVDIFDAANLLEISSVEDQREFRDQWIRSLQP